MSLRELLEATPQTLKTKQFEAYKRSLISVLQLTISAIKNDCTSTIESTLEQGHMNFCIDLHDDPVNFGKAIDYLEELRKDAR